jgi:GPH family glycoside/pentoside/hexuronide:cation symporter
MAELAGPRMAAEESTSPTFAAATSAPRFGLRDKILYATGDVAEGVKATAIGGFVLLYLNGVLGLPGWMAGLASGVALAIDAVIDPLIGYISDNTRSKWGRRHPYMVGAALPYLLGVGLLFSIPLMESQWALFAYAFAMLVFLRIAFSIFALPYAAIGAELARDYTERSFVMTLRTFWNLVGVITCQLLGYSVFMSGEGGLLIRENYIAFGWTCGAIVVVAMLVSAWSTYNLRHLMFDVPKSEKSAAARLLPEFGEVLRNHSFVILFVTLITFWLSQGAAAVMANHVLLYFWHMPGEAIAYVAVATTIGGGVGIPIAGLLLGFFEKRDVSVVALLIFCLLQFFPATLAVMGLMPAFGPLLIFILSTVGFIIGVLGSCAVISFGSMMMDAADEHEHLFGSRREGLYFAGLVFSVKAAVAGGLVIAGVALDVIGFPSGVATVPANSLDPDVIRNLGLVAGPGAAILSLTSVVVLTRYRLVKAKVVDLQKSLTERRQLKTQA